MYLALIPFLPTYWNGTKAIEVKNTIKNYFILRFMLFLVLIFVCFVLSIRVLYCRVKHWNLETMEKDYFKQNKCFHPSVCSVAMWKHVCLTIVEELFRVVKQNTRKVFINMSMGMIKCLHWNHNSDTNNFMNIFTNKFLAS